MSGLDWLLLAGCFVAGFVVVHTVMRAGKPRSPGPAGNEPEEPGSAPRPRDDR